MPPADFDPINLSTFLMVMFPPWVVASAGLYLYCKDKLTWAKGTGNSDF